MTIQAETLHLTERRGTQPLRDANGRSMLAPEPSGISRVDPVRPKVTKLTSAARADMAEPAGTARAMAAVLDALEVSLPRDARPELAPLVNWGGAVTLPIHRWFRYREAYSPGLIKELKLGQRILDPFCGCGSILVGAAQMGRLSIGVDINPLAIFVAQVKLTPLSSEQLRRVVVFAESFLQIAPKHEPRPRPALQIAGKVFEPDILDALLRLRGAIETTALDDRRVCDFLLLAWLAILEDVGSYFKEGNGIKYRNKKRLKTGYIRRPEGVWQMARFGADQRAFVYRVFADQLSTMIADTAEWISGLWNKQRAIEGNTLGLKELLGSLEYDSIIFSPPYANRFDYFESQKVELWFGNFVNSYDDLALLRKRSVRSHLAADRHRSAITIEPLEQLITLMDQRASSWRMGVPSILRGYFDDMYQTLLQCRALAPKGRCHIVVGNSAFAGVIIPTDSLIAQLGLEAGFSSARLLVARHLTVAPQQRTVLRGRESYMRESVVVLE